MTENLNKERVELLAKELLKQDLVAQLADYLVTYHHEALDNFNAPSLQEHKIDWDELIPKLALHLVGSYTHRLRGPPGFRGQRGASTEEVLERLLLPPETKANQEMQVATKGVQGPTGLTPELVILHGPKGPTVQQGASGRCYEPGQYFFDDQVEGYIGSSHGSEGFTGAQGPNGFTGAQGYSGSDGFREAQKKEQPKVDFCARLWEELEKRFLLKFIEQQLGRKQLQENTVLRVLEERINRLEASSILNNVKASLGPHLVFFWGGGGGIVANQYNDRQGHSSR